MSVLHPYEVQCDCGSTFEALMAESVNVGRMPNAREEILSGVFHRFVCPGCNKELTIEKEFLYTDLDRNTFIKVRPPDKRHLWIETSRSLEQDVNKVPETLATSNNRNLRVVFGLGELREKLITQDWGIDDQMVELLKVLLISDHPVLLKYPRLRLQLNGIDEEKFEFVSSYEHENKTFKLELPQWTVNDLITNVDRAREWVSDNHGQASIFELARDHWINIWRWSPQPSALATLRRIAEQIQSGQSIDTASREFELMLQHLPRGTHLPAWAKRDLQTLFSYAHTNSLDHLQDALLELRFDLDLEDDWSLNSDPNDIATIWKLLQDLPDTNVAGNSSIREILLAEGQGGGWYEPGSHDIYIGEDELPHQESFEDVLRHEVGHAVHDEFISVVNPWLESEFGWQVFGMSNADIDHWVALMGGWGPLNSTEQAQARSFLRHALGPGNSWNAGPAPNPPANHPWWRSDFGPRLAYERSGDSWYANNTNWYRYNGKAFFLNFWYRTLIVVNDSTLDLINNGMPSAYAAMSHFEFFAELYALYYDLDDPMRPNIPPQVTEWLEVNIGVTRSLAPMPTPTPAEELPEWHWITRP